jgi:metallo-beta-lactamase family protein
MKVQFCGAAGMVTGSSHLLKLDNGTKILLDCGLYQGGEEIMESFNNTWYFEPDQIDHVILSHAHIDHCGRIPKLVKDGFKGLIHCTYATRSLCQIMLMDSAKIQEKDAEYENKKRVEKGKLITPLYTSKDVENAMELFVGYSYDKWFQLDQSVAFLFKDAGHILGSASITLKIDDLGKSIRFGFTGDIGRPSRPILKDPQPMPEVDYLICESTYGDREHEESPAQKDRFLRIIEHTCMEKKGKLIIPAFSLGRTQELVYLLDQMENEGQLPHIPVYVDSPLSINATLIFGAHPECFDKELHDYMLTDPNPFGFNHLNYIRSIEDSKAINMSNEPCIIISSSGMMNAGRVKHHLFHAVDNAKNTLLMAGYAAPDTPGGMLRTGIQHIKLFGEWKPVRIEIEIMDSFSAHGDRLEMLDFIKNQRKVLKKMFLVHGEPEKQASFRAYLQDVGFENIDIPGLGDEVEI